MTQSNNAFEAGKTLASLSFEKFATTLRADFRFSPLNVALLVAIPAMFGYNYLVNRIRSMIMGLDNYAAELRLDFERWYVDHAVERRVAPAEMAAAPVAAAVPLKKKARLNVQELPVASLSGESQFVGHSQPSHRIVKRQEPVPVPVPVPEPLLVDGEFDLEGGREA